MPFEIAPTLDDAQTNLLVEHVLETQKEGVVLILESQSTLPGQGNPVGWDEGRTEVSVQRRAIDHVCWAEEEERCLNLTEFFFMCDLLDETVGDQRQKWNGLLQERRVENPTRLFRLYVLNGSHATFMYRRYRAITNRESGHRVRIVGLPTDLNSKTGTISGRSRDLTRFDVNLDDNSTGDTISIDPVNLNFLLW